MKNEVYKTLTMSQITKKTTLSFAFFFFVIQLFSQNNANDYWLNNGFTSGQTIFTNSGFFYDDGGDSLYNPGQEWFVTFCSENGNPITLDFDGFRTDYRGGSYGDWDYMTINYTGSVPLVAYDDDTPQFSFTSPDGCIRFGFKSQPAGVSIPDSGWVAEISANPPPLNNDPCSAADLVVGNVCSPSFFTNKGAWDTRGLGNPSCHSFFGGDVWFSAVVPDSGKLKIETLPGTLKYAIMVLYTGSCGSLVESECVDNPGLMPSYTFTDLTPGETVYLRVFGDQAKSGTFGICATDPTAEISGFTGPGGVGDSLSNRLWLRADKVEGTNGTGIPVWKDFSGNENDISQSSTLDQPVFIESGINSIPSVSFDGTQNFMNGSLGLLSAPVNIFTVNNFAVTKDQAILAIGDANDQNTLSIGRENISNNYYTFTNGKQYGQALPSDAQILFTRHQVNSPYHSYTLNGTAQVVNYTEGQVSTNGSFILGTDKDQSDFLDGLVSEVIVYSKKLNLAQEIIVSNYLSAKYGITIENDYFNFQNTHPHDLAGIGRVDQNNTHSKAQSAGIISIGGASEFEDGEFLFIGHDGTDFQSWTSTDIPSSDPEIVRLEREWKTGVKGNGPGLVTVSLDTVSLPPLPEGYLAYNLMVDADGDFSEGAEFFGLIPGGDELIANNVPLSNGDIIAIMAIKSKLSFSLPESSGYESVERPEIFVELTYAVSEPVTVEYSVISGTATRGEDYSLNDNTIVFNPGERLKEIIPLIFEDTIVETPDEYFTIQLSDPDAGVLTGEITEHTYTILDNDFSLSVSATDTTIGECVSSETTLSATVSGQGPFTYNWTPLAGLDNSGAAITNAKPSVTTYYVVSVSDGTGTTLKDSIEIVVEPSPAKPSIIPGDNQIICEGEELVLSAPDGYFYSWSNGSSDQTITVAESGKFAVTISDDNGCESPPSDTIEITLSPLPPQPTISINGDTEFCIGGSVELTSSEAASYLWSNGEITRTITVSQSGNYSVITTNEFGCSSIPSAEVIVEASEKPGKPVISFDGDTDLCEGESVELSAPEGYTYQWSNGSDSRTITVSESGDYWVQVFNGGCASDQSDAVSIIVHPLPEKPIISPEGPVEIMQGESVTLTSTEANGYLWSNSETSRETEISETGEYTVTVSNEQGCESEPSDPVSVTVINKYPAPEVSITGETEFCEGGSVILTSGEAYAYRWSNGETSQSITVSESGSYSLIIEDEDGIESESSQAVVVEVFENPEASAQVMDALCFNSSDGSIQLNIAGGETPYDVSWEGGMTGADINGLNAGAYSATITDANGCSTSIQAEVGEPDEIIIDAEITDASCPEAADGEILLSASGGTPPFIYSTANSQGPDFNELAPGTYQFTVIDGNNCEKTSSFNVGYVAETCLHIPDIITPNSDGKNDEWVIEGLELYPDVTVEIFDRWGKRVFYSRGYESRFTGRFNGKELPMESYHYIINLNDGSPVIIGNITIVR
jgi:gliding motility-associated-like protein